MNQLHIDDRAAAGTDELVEELHHRAAPAVKARRRVPGPLRRIQIPNGDLTMGELLDVVQTRDVWMHRIDVCQATGREPELTPEHDGRLVADAVRDWADKHGKPFTLRLTGTAGGDFAPGPRVKVTDTQVVDPATISRRGQNCEAWGLRARSPRNRLVRLVSGDHVPSGSLEVHKKCTPRRPGGRRRV